MERKVGPGRQNCATSQLPTTSKITASHRDISNGQTVLFNSFRFEVGFYILDAKRQSSSMPKMALMLCLMDIILVLIFLFV